MKIVFLDRDGVINEFPGNGKYVTRVKDFHFIPGSLEAIRRLTKAGYTLFVVSNQAGVGKGIYSKRKLDQITAKMLCGVKKTGGRIRKVFYSIRRSDEGCPYRKPNIGSVLKAMALLKSNLHGARNGYFIGDTETDIRAGHNAGCKTIFVLSGREDH
ncbi:MAG: HAD-IIIA family hydrolase, partial [Candidatus Omnitrophota bacterium]|nr:HAD-IIIA family hydrolase [Candidatus Omnitrophota bacterium]